MGISGIWRRKGRKKRGKEREKKKNTEPIVNSTESRITGRKKQANKESMLRENTKEGGKK